MQVLRPYRRLPTSPAEQPRRATATVELAICLPVMLILTFGAIEASNGIYLKQIVTQASYEGARVATTVGATQADAEAFAQQVLDARDIQGATIDIQPKINSTTPSGTEVTVTVTAPSNANAIAPLWYFNGRNVVAQVVMVRN